MGGPWAHLPIAMIVEAADADRAALKSSHVCEHVTGTPRVFVLISLVPNEVLLLRMNPSARGALHDHLRDTVVRDFAAHGVSAKGRSGSAALGRLRRFEG